MVSEGIAVASAVYIGGTSVGGKGGAEAGCEPNNSIGKISECDHLPD